MSQQAAIVARRAFQQNHFLLVDAGKTQTVGLHQYMPLVDDERSIRAAVGEKLPKEACVRDLAGLRYCTIPRLFAVKAHGLVDVQKEHGVMQRFASLCAAIMQRSDPTHAAKLRALLGAQVADSFDPISATQFLNIAEDVAEATRDSAFSVEMGDGAVYVTTAQFGAQIFVELETTDPKRAPQAALTNGMYTCEGIGPVHLIGGVEALVVSRTVVRFAAGIQKDRTAEMFEDSGMPEANLKALHLQITQEDSNVDFLQEGDSVPSLPIPNHGVMMRAMAGGVGVWEGEKLIHVLQADNGAALLCHPDARMVQLKPTTPTARLLKVPFKLN